MLQHLLASSVVFGVLCLGFGDSSHYIVGTVPGSCTRYDTCNQEHVLVGL
jgi:hypothetical protein